MNTEMAREYAELVAAIRGHEDEIDTLKARKAELEPEIIEEWQQEGVNQARVDGVTLYLKQDIYATTPEGKPAAIEMLKHGPFADVVQETVNSNTLSALVRERIKAGEELPAEWEGIIGSGERWSVGVRKA